MLSQTHTHCAQPLHRSTATYADPYLRPFSLPALSSYRMVLASGQYCVHSLQLVAAQISTLMSATRYMQVSSSSVSVGCGLGSSQIVHPLCFSPLLNTPTV